MMTCKKQLLFVLLILLVSVSGADQIILKEGKTLSGTILDETATQYYLEMGKNMHLYIDKSKVKAVKRKGRRPKRTVSAPKRKKASKKKKRKAAVKALKNVQEKESFRKSKKNNIVVNESLVTKTYDVGGRRFEQAMAAIYDRDTGKGFKGERKRRASKTSLRLSWDGTPTAVAGKTKWGSLVLHATTTVMSPYWNVKKKPSKASIEKWNEFVGRLKIHDAGHIKIYARTLFKVGESLAELQAKDHNALRKKSDAVVKKILQQTKYRQRGHDRRAKIYK